LIFGFLEERITPSFNVFVMLNLVQHDVVL